MRLGIKGSRAHDAWHFTVLRAGISPLEFLKHLAGIVDTGTAKTFGHHYRFSVRSELLSAHFENVIGMVIEELLSAMARAGSLLHMGESVRG